ncbi:hypothetical protein A3860_06515 [Niastella vici]|uniref:Nuclease n=1 Tax=Niastella vici TaxID=1703345 RepID=A0A1V9FSQ6_9BACT|nr:hypothetical protein [Niastella vici]OQP61358.1 hypothetical protein A3860_06515 [Niastella vici]
MNYLVFVLTLLLLAGSSCNHHKVVIVNNHRTATHRLPPGQAKKLTGEKSARAYAPGQQKRN